MLYFFKKSLCIILCFCELLLLANCNTKALPMNEVVNKILLEKGIEKSKIIRLCNNDNKFVSMYQKFSITIREEDLNKYVGEILSTHEKMIEIKDRNYVQSGDVAVVSYVVKYNDEIVANAEREALLVGSGKYFPDFENAIIGKKVGQPFVCEIKSPIDTEKYKKDEILQYNVTIESINYFKTYKSSDRYILNYYGCHTEEEFLNKCELRLKEIKRKENKSASDEDFLNKIAKECKFSINKEEAVEYSKQIVEQHKNLAYISGLELEEYIKQTLNMTQEEFYDYCYDCGVNEIKQYLLIGANTADTTFDREGFAEFCSMTGYDSNDDENSKSKYHYLKTITIAHYRHSVRLLPAYVVPLFEDKTFSLEVYESSNLYAMNSSDYKKHTITSEEQNKLINSIANLSLGESLYTDTLNQLYNYVLILRSDDEIAAVIMLDEVNKFVKMHQSNGDTVCDTFEETDLDELLKDVVK